MNHSAFDASFCALTKAATFPMLAFIQRHVLLKQDLCAENQLLFGPILKHSENTLLIFRNQNIGSNISYGLSLSPVLYVRKRQDKQVHHTQLSPRVHSFLLIPHGSNLESYKDSKHNYSKELQCPTTQVQEEMKHSSDVLTLLPPVQLQTILYLCDIIATHYYCTSSLLYILTKNLCCLFFFFLNLPQTSLTFVFHV